MKRFTMFALGILLILTLNSSVFADPISIAEYDDLIINTTVEGIALKLNEGFYAITQSFNIMESEYIVFLLKTRIIRNAICFET